MDIMKPIKNLFNAQLMRARYASQKGRITRLDNQVKRLQALVKDDILTLQEKAAKYKGNQYTSYEKAVEEINNKYNGTADWGVLQTGNIIDLRAAFIMNEGPKIVKKAENAKAEYDFAVNFLEYNDLDKEVAQEYAKEAEIEGKLAIKLSPKTIKATNGDSKEKEAVMISAIFISWTEKKYKVDTDPQDYMKFTKMKWMPKNKNKEETLEEGEFVYKKFGGRIDKPNTPAPKIMKCLTQVEHLDMALRDWREINRIFAAPTPHIECKDAKEAKAINDEIKANPNFKIRKFFAHTGSFSYASPDMAGVNSLKEEIMTSAKMVSGTTSIPLQALGLPEFMSNRSTAENLMEFVLAGTSKERETWKGAFKEIITKAMNMYNEEVNKGMSNMKKLNPDKIDVEIPVVTKEQWEHLEKVYLPAVLAGKISDETFIEAIPGLDTEKELKRREDKDKSDLEQTKKENEDLKANLANKDSLLEGDEYAL